MKIPHDIGASRLIRALRVLRLRIGATGRLHIHLTTTLDRTHHVTVPNHRLLKTGTLLGGVLKPVALHHKLTIKELLAKLDL